MRKKMKEEKKEYLRLTACCKTVYTWNGEDMNGTSDSALFPTGMMLAETQVSTIHWRTARIRFLSCGNG